MSKFLISEVPTLKKFEDRSHEETERQERCAQSRSWNIAKNVYKLKENDKTTFYSLAEEWRKFLVDSGASLHMVSKKDLNYAEFEDRYTSHVIFLMHFTRVNDVHITLLGSSVCMCGSFHLHVIHDERLSVCLFFVVSSFWLSPCVSPSPCSSLPTSTCTLTWTRSSMWTTPRQLFPVPPSTEESCPLAGYTPPTELETMRTSRSPTTVMTANSEVRTREEATVYVKQLDLFVTFMLLEETPEVLSLRKFCEDHGYTYYWTSCQKPHLTQKGKRIDCNISNYVPFVVPGLSTSSFTTPTPTSPTPSSQDSVFDISRHTENPVPKRSGSTSEELQGNPLHGPTETENTNQNEGHEEVQTDLLRDLPDWPQELRENVVDESSPFRNTVKPCAWGSRHFQFFSWNTNGAASKSGTGFVWA